MRTRHMKNRNTEGIKAWITCLLFGMILLCHRTEVLPFGKDLAQTVFENVAIRYDEILSEGLSVIFKNVTK